MPNTPIIQAVNLDIGYHQTTVVKNFNAEIFPGEFIVVLGPNGAGKTTLLRTLLGLIKAQAGELIVQGHSPHRGCAVVGYMPQQLTLPNLHNLSGRTLLTACQNGQQWGLPLTDEIWQEQIELCLKKVEANEFADQPFSKLSGGQQRRLLLAQALLGNPRVLLLDEPLANLDLRYQESFVELLPLLAKQQLTVILTAHEINPLLRAVSRVIYVANQRAILGNVKEVLNSERLSQLYQTPVEVIDYQGRLLVMHAASGKIDHASDCG